jgi:hypothetical protein
MPVSAAWMARALLLGALGAPAVVPTEATMRRWWTIVIVVTIVPKTTLLVLAASLVGCTTARPDAPGLPPTAAAADRFLVSLSTGESAHQIAWSSTRTLSVAGDRTLALVVEKRTDADVKKDTRTVTLPAGVFGEIKDLVLKADVFSLEDSYSKVTRPGPDANYSTSESCSFVLDGRTKTIVINPRAEDVPPRLSSIIDKINRLWTTYAAKATRK